MTYANISSGGREISTLDTTGVTVPPGNVCFTPCQDRVVAASSEADWGVVKARRTPCLHLRVPDPIVDRERDGIEPEQEAVVAGSVGLALLVLLETLSPAERIAFVLHDVFALPFGEISPIIGRSPAAARQLASRARCRVRGAVISPDADLAGQRKIVDAFLAAVRGGDFQALLAVLDPEVVLRADYGAAGESREVRGAREVAEGALTFSQIAPFAQPALVNGAAGVVVAPRGRPFSVMGFTVARGRIVEIYILADPARLKRLDLSILDG